MNKISGTKKSILGMLAMAGLAYTGTLTAMVGYGEVDAARRELPSSVCHARHDNQGTVVDNAGELAYTGTGGQPIYCPVIGDSINALTSSADVDVHGREGTDGANSRTCACDNVSVNCGCSTHTNWVNNSGGITGAVALNIAAGAWAIGPAQKWAYIHHNLTQNSVLSGTIITTP